MNVPYETWVVTTYGVVLQAMERGDSFLSLREQAKLSTKQLGYVYGRTAVEMLGDRLHIVLYYFHTYKQLENGENCYRNEVPVPFSYMKIAKARYYEQ